MVTRTLVRQRKNGRERNELENVRLGHVRISQQPRRTVNSLLPLGVNERADAEGGEVLEAMVTAQDLPQC